MTTTKTLSALSLIALVAAAEADSDSRKSERDVPPAAHAVYAAECGSCHLAYPPGLLPARSWQRLLDGLSDHFGDNAELGPAELKSISDYLAQNAADRAPGRRSIKILGSLRANDAPLRISETPYIVAKHRELPPRLVRDNPKVKRLGQCNACHTRAEAGSFSEREIVVPGYGRWDD